jgi:hypothetical protein
LRVQVAVTLTLPVLPVKPSLSPNPSSVIAAPPDWSPNRAHAPRRQMPHSCSTSEALNTIKLMLKWPGLHYSTSAFAPKYYPTNIVEYANSRGADKIIYAGYFPMGLSLERIVTELADVGFKDHVWPKFLRTNALRVLGIDCS